MISVYLPQIEATRALVEGVIAETGASGRRASVW